MDPAIVVTLVISAIFFIALGYFVKKLFPDSFFGAVKDNDPFGTKRERERQLLKTNETKKKSYFSEKISQLDSLNKKS